MNGKTAKLLRRWASCQKDMFPGKPVPAYRTLKTSYSRLPRWKRHALKTHLRRRLRLFGYVLHADRILGGAGGEMV